MSIDIRTLPGFSPAMGPDERIALVNAAQAMVGHTPGAPNKIVVVMPEFGGDAFTAHLPVRTAGQPFSGPTVYVTACGQYAHTVQTGDALAVCVPCHSTL